MNYLKSSLIALIWSLTLTAHADVMLKGLDGRMVSFSSLKGKWVLINYWASWCKNCVTEIPELNRFYQKHAQDPVALFAVNYDALPAEAQNDLIMRFNIKYPSLKTDPAFALGLGDIVGVPVTFVFNPAGELVNTLYGEQNLRSLEEAMTT